MTHIEQAIRDAKEKGGYDDLFRGNPFLDPAFWQALGKARGWGEGGGISDPQWLVQWHSFIDHLAEGKDAENFFKKL